MRAKIKLYLTVSFDYDSEKDFNNRIEDLKLSLEDNRFYEDFVIHPDSNFNVDDLEIK